MTSTADIFDGITKMEVQPLVSDEVPRLDVAASVVAGTCGIGVGHFLTRLDIELPSTKHWRCKARKIVMMSSFFDSG